MAKQTRRFIDAPNAERCKATITLRDGSGAQCGRRVARLGAEYCWQHEPKQSPVDLSVQHDGGHGSIYLLRDHTDAGRDWIIENVGDDATMTWGDAVVVEHRYIQDIIDGARRDGLIVGPA